MPHYFEIPVVLQFRTDDPDPRLHDEISHALQLSSMPHLAGFVQGTRTETPDAPWTSFWKAAASFCS